MLHTNNPIIKHKAGLLNLAEELGNVSRDCKVMGVSRDTFYRYQELIEDGGIDNVVVPMLKIVSIRKLNRQLKIMRWNSLPTVNTAPAMNCVSRVSLSRVVVFVLSGYAIIWKTSKNG